MVIVAAPMTSTTAASTLRRPIRSPRLPQNTPPTGRARNATPYSANVASSAAAGSLLGKNSVAMTGTDAE
jgi:hypothetical protein